MRVWDSAWLPIDTAPAWDAVNVRDDAGNSCIAVRTDNGWMEAYFSDMTGDFAPSDDPVGFEPTQWSTIRLEPSDAP